MPAFAPRSIAVIGASESAYKVGHMVLKNLLEQGFQGEVFPVNPKGGTILGKKVYASITEIPSPIDMAIIVTPANTVPEIAEECGKKGVLWLVVISAGFSETHTEEGKSMENDLAAIAKEHSMKLIGPNCLGVLNPRIGMNASFAKDLPECGNIALISQSGAMAVALMDMSRETHLGYSLVLSIGNKALMNESDFLELCSEDEETNVIGLYLESIADGKRFLESALRISQKKRIILLKSGISEHGKRAASSHTGALAGSDGAIAAACAQAGIHRAKTSEKFLMLLKTLSTQPPLPSNHIAIITNAGGPGILATDAAEAVGLTLSSLSKKNLAMLSSILPKAASTVNPIDVVGDATADRYITALTACGQDPNIDGLCVLLTPQVMTPCEEIATAVAEFHEKFPLMPVVASFMGGDSVRKARGILAENGIPNFPLPEDAIGALAALRGKPRSSMAEIRESPPWKDIGKVQKLLNGKTGLLSDNLAGELLALYGIPMPDQKLAHTANEAAAFAKDIGFPVIAKVSSPRIPHKTDVGGIKANLKTDEEVQSAFQEMFRNVEVRHPGAEIRGILIQKFLPPGNEFIVGSLRDPSFGPLIMVGLGGIYTELLRDTTFRIAPVSEEESYVMLTELKSWEILLGMRGKAQSDIAALAKLIVAVSLLVTDMPSIRELDLNPVRVDADGVTVLDAKIVIQS